LKTHYQNVEFTRLNVYGGAPFDVSQIIEAVGPASPTPAAANGSVSHKEAPAHA
jgi:hypothetical protein